MEIYTSTICSHAYLFPTFLSAVNTFPSRRNFFFCQWRHNFAQYSNQSYSLRNTFLFLKKPFLKENTAPLSHLLNKQFLGNTSSKMTRQALGNTSWPHGQQQCKNVVGQGIDCIQKNANDQLYRLCFKQKNAQARHESTVKL